MLPRAHSVAAAFAAAVMLAAPPATAQDQAVQLRATKVSKMLAAGDFDDPAWQKVPAKEVSLTTAFAAHPAISGEARTKSVRVQAAKAPQGVAFRLQWQDDTSSTVRAEGRFADAVALQFALDRKPDTIPFMGGGGRLVNIWYWNAAKDAAQSLVADGFGTTTPLKTQDVTAKGRHANGVWTVVFVRGYRTAEKDAIALSRKPGRYPIGFAVWEGANEERDGFKAVTMAWQNLGL